ncbi:MAG: hypothetical protein BGO07_00560 [Alphaproteobacteria bacterium 40-19]|nr:MAG: hypothetical protein BGO07_00560 [Alphaproteobacteria bacterium 40-19]
MFVSASLLSAHPLSLGAEIQRVETACDQFHWDIMDGHFVPNMSFGPGVIQKARSVTQKPFDVHLMVQDAQKVAPLFWDLPIQTLSFHPNCCPDPQGLIQGIQNRSLQAGMAVDLSSDFQNWPDQWWHCCAVALVMGVVPGFSGQAFSDQALVTASWLKKKFPHLTIVVDGGVEPGNVGLIQQSGAEGVVSGSYLFAASEPMKAYQALKKSSVKKNEDGF